MVARFVGAGLGLLAFTVTVVAGLSVHNPVSVILSRSILALFLFCFIGLVLGTVAQAVVAEHERKRASDIQEKYREQKISPGEQDSGEEIRGDEAAPAGA